MDHAETKSPAPPVNGAGPGRAAARRAAAVARRATPALVGLILIVGLAAVSLRIGAASLGEAEASRLAARDRLVESAVSRTTFPQDNRPTADYLAILPPSRTDPAHGRTLLTDGPR